MPVKVSVIIPVFQDWDRLALCLDALERQTLEAREFEIIIANNEPVGRARPLRLPANAQTVHEPRPGSYAARNRAVALSQGRFLAFTDSDCVPRPQWLESALAILEAEPAARVTGPIPVFREPGTNRFVYVYEFHTAFRQELAVGLGKCATANLLVARNVFDAVGPFNGTLASGGDTEWGERAHALGVPIRYDARVAVEHPARRSVAEIIRKKRRIAGSLAQRKSYPAWRYFLYRLLPPFRHYYRNFIGFRRGPIRALDIVVLFFLHWLGQLAEGQEFLFVRKGWKSPNRS
jgi:GT2 family glycosyltransferase